MVSVHYITSLCYSIVFGYVFSLLGGSFFALKWTKQLRLTCTNFKVRKSEKLKV